MLVTHLRCQLIANGQKVETECEKLNLSAKKLKLKMIVKYDSKPANNSLL